MPFTQDANSWLDDVDPWCMREALDLLEATQGSCTAGVFECATNAEGSRWFIMAPHAENVLLLPSADAWRAFMAEVIDRYGLRLPMRLAPTPGWEPPTELPDWAAAEMPMRSANESRLMQLLDAAHGAQR